MKQEAKKFLSVLFNEGEEVCWSYDQKATYSTPQDKIDEDAQLIAINPIEGKREDMNVKGHRSILVELDVGNLGTQYEYVKRMGLPFSGS